ncbi:response regulator transcription factor [Cohnella cellulosilytica]|uniref:Response regulator n=1 Tax=Cohnella cellulosilytica TaxID=986710 RepID=A0ABW2F4T0_9BACL
MIKRTNMLIVDDETLVSSSLSAMDDWSERNIQIIGTASSGKEAMSLIEQSPVNIVVTDIQMADGDGLDLLKYIHAHYPHIAVIIISGHESFQFAHTALKFKARGYVLKPIDTDELFELIDNILEEMQQTDERMEASVFSEQPAISSEDIDAPMTYHETIVERAIDYIKQNLELPLTLRDVANKHYLTPHYFGQIFKTVTGDNFTAYLTKLRMQKACELLKNPELKNYNISSLIGYSDVKYFTRLFLRSHGKTPKEYRQQLVSNRKIH